MSSIKRILSVFLAALMLFAALPAGALAQRAEDARVKDITTEPQMIETDLPSGIYDDGRTLIIHPDDGDMVFDYDPEAADTSSTGTRDAASDSDLDAALNIYGADFEFDNAVSSYPWEVVSEGGRFSFRTVREMEVRGFE